MGSSYVTTVSGWLCSESNLDPSIISGILHDFMYVEKSEKLCVRMSSEEGRLFYTFWLSINES